MPSLAALIVVSGCDSRVVYLRRLGNICMDVQDSHGVYIITASMQHSI